MLSSINSAWLGVAPFVLAQAPNLEPWVQGAGSFAGIGILLYICFNQEKKNIRLDAKIEELTDRLHNKCGSCDYVKASKKQTLTTIEKHEREH